MAEYRITGPDGAQHKVTASDAMTQEQVLQRFKDAQAATPAQAEQPQQDPLKAKLQGSVPGRVLQGMRDPLDAGAQLLPRGVRAVTSAFGVFPNPVSEFFGNEAKRVDQLNATNEREYQQARQAAAPKTPLITGQQDPGTDWWRLAGNVASPVNIAPAALLAKPTMAIGSLAATGAKAGAVGGLLTPVNEMAPGQEFWATKLAQMGLGAATGAVASPIVGKLAGSIARRLERAVVGGEVVGARASLEADNVIAAALADVKAAAADLPPGTMDRLRQEVVSAMKGGKKLDAAAALRMQDFQALGMTGRAAGPTAGQVTREPMQFATERNLRAVPGVGDPLLARFTNQNQSLAQKFSLLGADNAMESYPAGQQLVQSLSKADDRLSQGVRTAYQAARESSGKDANVSLQGLAQDYARVLQDFGDKVPSGVRNNFKTFGLDPAGQMKQTRMFSVEDADKLLKVINANVSSDPATNNALSQLRKAVKDAALSAGDDVFAAARKKAEQRFSIMDAVPALKAAAEGSTAPDDFVSRFVINGKVDDLRGMAKLIDPDATQQVRSQIVATLRRAAFGQNAAGDRAFSPERYAEKMRNIGTDKLRIFFNQGEIDQLKAMGRVGAYMNSPPANAPVMGNPNMFWSAPLTAMVDRVPLLGGMARGAMSGGRQALDVNAALRPQGIPATPYIPPNLEPALPYAGTVGGLGGGLFGATPLR